MGGYGIIACVADDIAQCVQMVAAELLKGGTVLAGFEWLNRLDHYEPELTDYARDLIGGLSRYPVQFHTFDWYLEKDSLH